MNFKELHQQIRVILNNKFGSDWRKSTFKKSLNSKIIERYICIKKYDSDCNCACSVINDYETKIASIYWNEKEHNHSIL